MLTNSICSVYMLRSIGPTLLLKPQVARKHVLLPQNLHFCFTFVWKVIEIWCCYEFSFTFIINERTFFHSGWRLGPRKKDIYQHRTTCGCAIFHERGGPCCNVNFTTYENIVLSGKNQRGKALFLILKQGCTGFVLSRICCLTVLSYWNQWLCYQCPVASWLFCQTCRLWSVCFLTNGCFPELGQLDEVVETCRKSVYQRCIQ